MQFAAGVLLKGRYRILERLGAGGMGEVYLGHDLEQRQPVAIKSMRRELETGETELFRRRFQEEIDILKRVNALGVPAFVDNFDEDDRTFLIMEYIQGHSLEALLERSRDKDFGGLRPSLVCEVGIQVCRILEHLHSQTPPLIHRDIKPSNIIIRSQDDQVFLVDFGLAREIHSKSSAKTLVGTAAYCPLEQFQGRPEPRSDIYSLGATMYELLTGCVPKPLNIPPIQDVLPNLHEDLVRIVNRSVRSLPHERYSQAADMRMMLEEVRPRLDQNLPPPTADAQEPTDRVEELIRRWGRGKIPEVMTPTLAGPKSLESSQLLASMKRAQARARELHRAPTEISLKVAGAALVLVVLATVGLVRWWSLRRETKIQRDLVAEMFPNGGPAAGWSLLQARGLFPADGLGLGHNNRNSTGRAGFVFGHPEGQTIKVMRCQLRRLKGTPKLLVYAQPNGILLEPQNNGYLVRIVNIEDGSSVDDVSYQPQKNGPKIAIGNFGTLELKLTVHNKTRASLSVERKPPVALNLAGPWLSKNCGVVHLNSSNGTRATVSGFVLQ